MRGHSCSVMPPSCETLAEVLREGVANLAGIASARWNRIGGLPGDCRTAVSVGAGLGGVPTWAAAGVEAGCGGAPTWAAVNVDIGCGSAPTWAAAGVEASRSGVPAWAGQASKNLLGGFEAMIVNAGIGGF